MSKKQRKKLNAFGQFNLIGIVPLERGSEGVWVEVFATYLHDYRKYFLSILPLSYYEDHLSDCCLSPDILRWV